MNFRWREKKEPKPCNKFRLNSVGGEKSFCGGGGGSGEESRHPTSHVTHLPRSQKRLSACRLSACFDRSLKRHHAVCGLATCDERRPGNWATAVKESLALRPQPWSLSPHNASVEPTIFSQLLPAWHCCGCCYWLRVPKETQRSTRVCCCSMFLHRSLMTLERESVSFATSARCLFCANNVGLVRLVFLPDDCDITPPLHRHTHTHPNNLALPTVERYPQTLTSLIT